MPNATFIGFTGTPIDRIAYGKGTFKVFGKNDEKGYLDKYSIAESIEDGTTLPLHYTLAPNDIRVRGSSSSGSFWTWWRPKGSATSRSLNRILDRAVNLKAFLKAPDRVDKVARFVARHFQENVDPLGYKAFLVRVHREACALYKKALDQHLPPEQSTVVYSPAYNDSPLLAEHRLSEDEEKRVRKAFLKPGVPPKILIVTEKLLTDFDAPILYCMYLDKPMRDHTLLQAIARVNRPYEEEGVLQKPAGFVLDFVGIFEKLETALAFDSDVVASVIQNLDVLKQRFSALMAGPATTMPLVKIDDKALAALKKTEAPPHAKVISLGKSLIQATTAGAEGQPYLVPIGERAEAILDTSDDRQIGTQEALRELEKLLREYVQAEAEREKTGFDLNTFTLYWALKQAGAPAPDRLAPALDGAFRRFPNHAHNAAELRQLKAELYRVLLPAVGKDRMVGLADRLLRLKRS